MVILQATARDKELLPASLARLQVNFIPGAGAGELLARMLCPVRSILEAKVGVEMEDTHMIRGNTEMLNPEPRTLEAVGVEGLEKATMTLTRKMVLLAVLASCA